MGDDFAADGQRCQHPRRVGMVNPETGETEAMLMRCDRLDCPACKAYREAVGKAARPRRHKRLGKGAPNLTPEIMEEAAAAVGATMQPAAMSVVHGRILRRYIFERAGGWDEQSLADLAAHLFLGDSLFPGVDAPGGGS